MVFQNRVTYSDNKIDKAAHAVFLVFGYIVHALDIVTTDNLYVGLPKLVMISPLCCV